MDREQLGPLISYLICRHKQSELLVPDLRKRANKNYSSIPDIFAVSPYKTENGDNSERTGKWVSNQANADAPLAITCPMLSTTASTKHRETVRVVIRRRHVPINGLLKCRPCCWNNCSSLYNSRPVIFLEHLFFSFPFEESIAIWDHDTRQRVVASSICQYTTACDILLHDTVSLQRLYQRRQTSYTQ